MTDIDQPPTSTERQQLESLDDTPHAHVFDGEPKTVRLSLAAGERVPAHRHPDREIVCFVVDGVLELTLGDEDYEVETGDVIRFDGAQEIEPTARTETTALLVLAHRRE